MNNYSTDYVNISFIFMNNDYRSMHTLCSYYLCMHVIFCTVWFILWSNHSQNPFILYRLFHLLFLFLAVSHWIHCEFITQLLYLHYLVDRLPHPQKLEDSDHPNCILLSLGPPTYLFIILYNSTYYSMFLFVSLFDWVVELSTFLYLKEDAKY